MRQQTFQKKQRLSLATDIQKIRKGGKKSVVSPFIITQLKNDLNYPRFVLSLARVVGSSVQRNIIRRYFREFFRKNKNSFGSKDYFFYTNRNLSKHSKKELKDLVEKAAYKILGVK